MFPCNRKPRLDSVNSTVSQETRSSILSTDSADDSPTDPKCLFTVGEETSVQSNRNSSGLSDQNLYESVGPNRPLQHGQLCRNISSFPAIKQHLDGPFKCDRRGVRTVPDLPVAGAEDEENSAFLQEDVYFKKHCPPGRQASVSSGYMSVNYNGNREPHQYPACRGVCRGQQEIEALRRSCRYQGRVTLTLVVLNVILIMCMLVTVPMLLLTKFIGGEPSPTTSNPWPVTDRQMCIDCTDDVGWYQKMGVSMDFVEQEGKCCFKSLGDVVDVAQKLAREEAIEASKDYLHMYGTNGGNTTVTNHFRSAIHLSNRVIEAGTSLARLSWEPDGKFPNGLKLSEDGSHLIAPSDGYFYIYSRVRYSKTMANDIGDFRFEIKLIRERRKITKIIETSQQRCSTRSGSVDHNGHISRVASLYKGDKIYVRVTSLDFLARDRKSHTFGMFEV